MDDIISTKRQLLRYAFYKASGLSVTKSPIFDEIIHSYFTEFKKIDNMYVIPNIPKQSLSPGNQMIYDLINYKEHIESDKKILPRHGHIVAFYTIFYGSQLLKEKELDDRTKRYVIDSLIEELMLDKEGNQWSANTVLSIGRGPSTLSAISIFLYGGMILALPIITIRMIISLF